MYTLSSIQPGELVSFVRNRIGDRSVRSTTYVPRVGIDPSRPDLCSRLMRSMLHRLATQLLAVTPPTFVDPLISVLCLGICLSNHGEAGLSSRAGNPDRKVLCAPFRRGWYLLVLVKQIRL